MRQLNTNAEDTGLSVCEVLLAATAVRPTA